MRRLLLPTTSTGRGSRRRLSLGGVGKLEVPTNFSYSYYSGYEISRKEASANPSRHIATAMR